VTGELTIDQFRLIAGNGTGVADRRRRGQRCIS
jgi:hypothetical protein